jgi:hypothetical protein
LPVLSPRLVPQAGGLSPRDLRQTSKPKRLFQWKSLRAFSFSYLDL